MKTPVVLIFYLKFQDFLVDIVLNMSKFLAWQYKLVWPYLRKSWFDHRFDQLRGPENFYWYERGILALQKIKLGGSVLDVGSGDGIYSALFYSTKAKNVDAIDLDKKAIEHAKKHYSRRNVFFKNSDVNDWLRKGKHYDTILLFSVIEHLGPLEGLSMLRGFKKSLNKDGVLYGSTPIFSELGGHNFEHKNEFLSQNDLNIFLKKVFRNVKLYNSVWPEGRRECYFECS